MNKPPGNWIGSIPAEESDAEFARQVAEMDGHQAQAVASSPEPSLGHQTESDSSAVQRPADDDRADAARYRWLRKELTWADAGDGDIKWVFWVPMGIPDALEPMRDLDAAIDEARKD